MKRSNILAIVGSLLLPIAFASIGSAKTTTIKFLIGNVKPNDIKTLTDAFHKDYPNIKVNAIVCAWNEVDDKFLAMTTGGQFIDVFCNNSVYGWARYIGMGLFSDLTPLIVRDKKELDPGDFSQMVLNAYKIKGKQYSIPLQHALANNIAYNANLLAQAGLPLPTTDWESKGWTWEDMLEYAKKLTKVGPDGKVTQFGIDFWDADNLITYSWANGGDWFDDDTYKTGQVQRLIINSPENQRAYTKLAELRTTHKVRPGVAPAKVGGGNTAYWAGTLAMWMDSNGLQDPTLNKKNYKWGMAPFPTMENGKRDAFAWMEVMAIPRSAKHREEAWTFVKWLSRKGLTKGITYPTNSARESVWNKALEWWPMEYSALSKQQLRQFIQGGIKHTRVLPRDIIFPSQQVWNAVNVELSPALYGKKSVAQALASAQKAGEIEVKKIKKLKN